MGYVSPCRKAPIFHVYYLSQFSCWPSTSFLLFLQSTSFSLSVIYLIPPCNLFFCYSRKTVSFLTRKVFLFSPIFVKSAFLQYEFLIRFSTLELSFLPCFSVTETFSVSSKCHCYRPNLLKCASPTVYWHQTLPYRFHCTYFHCTHSNNHCPSPSIHSHLPHFLSRPPSHYQPGTGVPCLRFNSV